ncbi:MAG TPA: NAD(P)/FAD-dependent oxidoreductase, partial [candidate division Zixibacteria bacterium]|nr:NAD(P)/FAD-dependent oxidoreductase [candidate division Zixibacteria bacterium]
DVLMSGAAERSFATPAPRDVYDITIIGAGPVGLYGAFYAGLRNAKTKVIEALPEVGGALKALYPEKYIYDIAGFPEVRAKDYCDQAYRQAAFYDTNFVLGRRVRDLVRRPDGLLELHTKQDIHYSRTVIIASGMGAFMPRRLDVPRVRDFEGKGIYYVAKNFERFRGQRVLIVGGGDSAFDYAMALEHVAARVDLIHRSSRFAAHEESVERVKRSNVNLHYPYWEVKAVHGTDALEGVTAIQTQTGEDRHFDVDAMIVSIGFLANLGPIKNWGLEVSRGAIKVDELMRTNIEGVYAAGDTVTHPGKIKLITTGCGEIAIAVNHAKTYVEPSEELNPGHSSHMKR